MRFPKPGDMLLYTGTDGIGLQYVYDPPDYNDPSHKVRRFYYDELFMLLSVREALPAEVDDRSCDDWVYVTMMNIDGVVIMFMENPGYWEEEFEALT